MQTLTSFDELASLLQGHHCCLTIGVFDGVHLGHQALLHATVAEALSQDLPAVAVTFANHPLSVLAPPYTPKRLVSGARKAQLLHAAGADYVVMLDFDTQLASVLPEAFVQDLLIGKAHIRSLICGYDFTFGCRGAGNAGLLQSLATELGFTLHLVDAVNHDGRPVKSTHIRDLLSDGQVSQAASLLSRPHELPGNVVHGAKRGRTIGFPTANLAVDSGFQLPAQGVYLCAARIADESKLLPAMVNVGTNPTFQSEQKLSIEAHLLDFEGDIHGEALSLYFLERLRNEQKFPSVDALVDQLQRDRQQSLQLWDTTPISEALQAIPPPLIH